MLTVLTIDDEPLASKRLEVILGRMENLKLVGNASGCADGIALIKDRRPDVVLLDIHMRDGTGFDVVDALAGADSPAIIFVTAFDHFAIKAFEVAAIDYVLKPIDPARLTAAFEKVRRAQIAPDRAGRFEEMTAVITGLRARLAENSVKQENREVWVRAATGTLTRIDLNDVEWVTSEDDYVRLHMPNGSHLLRLSIAGLERRVDGRKYVRVHRSALVRIDCIREVRRSARGGSEVVMANGVTIAAGRIYARRLRKAVTMRGTSTAL